MRIWDVHLNEQTDLLSALDMGEGAFSTISVVGAGGKTSLIFALGQAFAARGKRVIITTTTHMFSPEYQRQMGEPLPFPFVLDGDPAAVSEAINTAGGVIVGLPMDENPRRMKGLPPAELSLLRPYADVLLIEADGSRRLPCKAPGAHEPVIFPDTDLVIAVLGLDSLGKSISEVCFRPERAAALLGKTPDDILTETDLAILMTHKSGLRKNVTVPFIPVLNKADTDERRLAARRIAAMLASKGEKAFITCLVKADPQQSP